MCTDCVCTNTEMIYNGCYVQIEREQEYRYKYDLRWLSRGCRPGSDRSPSPDTGTLRISAHMLFFSVFPVRSMENHSKQKIVGRLGRDKRTQIIPNRKKKHSNGSCHARVFVQLIFTLSFACRPATSLVAAVL